MFLKVGEAKQVTFHLDMRSFAIFDPRSERWVVPSGTYNLFLGASSRDIRQTRQVSLHSEANVAALQDVPAWYRDPRGEVSLRDFEALLGKPAEPVAMPKKGQFTMDCSQRDRQGSFVVKAMIRWMEGNFSKAFGGLDYHASFRNEVVSSKKWDDLVCFSKEIHLH